MTGPSSQTGSSFILHFLPSCRAYLVQDIPFRVQQTSLAKRAVMFREYCAGHTTCVAVFLSLFGLILTRLLATIFAEIPLIFRSVCKKPLFYWLALHFFSRVFIFPNRLSVPLSLEFLKVQYQLLFVISAFTNPEECLLKIILYQKIVKKTGYLADASQRPPPFFLSQMHNDFLIENCRLSAKCLFFFFFFHFQLLALQNKEKPNRR